MHDESTLDLESDEANRATLLVRLTPTLLEQIRVRAVAADRSMAAEVRQALRRWVEA